MSRLKPIDFAGIFGGTEPQPAATSRPVRPGPPVDRRTWIIVALLAVVAFMMFAMFGRGLIPDVDPRPDVDIDGKYVLFLKDESRRESITEGQGVVMTSVKILDWCKENGVDMRVLDVRDGTISEMEPVWDELRKVADVNPSMTTLKDRKVVTQPVPSTVDAAIKELESRFK